MNIRRFAAELSAIVVCAALCATVSNLLAGRERRMAVVGRYPAAMTLPQAAPPQAASGPVAVPETPAPVPADAQRGPSPAPAAAPHPAAASVDASRAQKAPKESAIPAAPAVGAPATSPRSELLSRFPHPDRPFVEISGEQAIWAHGHGVPFLDARRTKVYEEGHVAGARSFSVWEADVDQKIFAFQDEASRELPVILYCSGGECEDSHMLADKLFGAGFTDALVYRDGWPDWVKRGGASRTGPTP